MDGKTDTDADTDTDNRNSPNVFQLVPFLSAYGGTNTDTDAKKRNSSLNAYPY